ncbi:general substrate transporter [Thozetella sp. PMI_491]|nr:general substrate transporter [Thozetella sp. PMI_491]
MASTQPELEKGATAAAPDVPETTKGATLDLDATREVVEMEHELKFWDAVRQYPSATFWSYFFGIAVIMAGFDAQIITSFYALPAFQARFGDPVGDDQYEISAQWQMGLGMGNPIGQILGALASGWLMEIFGRRLTLAACCVYSIIFVFVQFFSNSIQVLCVGEVLGGLAYGFYVVIAPTYSSEICPLALRGVLTASVNLMFVIGQFIGQGCAAGLETRLDEWSYKIPFAIQWIWPVAILAALPFAPESPYWLVRKGRREEARKSLLKLTSAKNRPDIDQVLLGIEQTDLLEQEMEDTTTYMDCFRGKNLLRTEISIMVYLIQVIGGNPLIGYANYFFEQAGLPTTEAFNMGVGNTAMGFVGTIVSWPLMAYFKFGRRTIYSGGMIFMTLLLFIIGFLSIPTNNMAAVWGMASLMNVWTFTYQMTVGPICFVIISEISATRLRNKTIAIATAVQALFSIVFTVAIPYMLNSDEANWGGKAGFLFGGISFACLIWCYFRLPESANRTYEELDLMFQRGVPLREFKTYVVLEGTTDFKESEKAVEAL